MKTPTAEESRGQPRSKFVGIREAAEMLGVSYSAVWDALRRGDFPVPSVQIGSKWRISRVFVPVIEVLHEVFVGTRAVASPATSKKLSATTGAATR